MEKEKIIIVYLNRELNISDSQLNSKINEIEELVRASGSEVLTTVIQNLDNINSKYYIGSGKVLEIKELADSMEADTVLFNNELTGSQMKNLEDIIDRKIIDRTSLILDIFSKRAKTKEARLQIKLAQLEYRLPRLVGFRNYLSREGAGVGTRGPGEQKLEIDRRTIQREISSIKRELKSITKKREVKRSRRINSNTPLVSLIGYSNAGKSTILNKLTERYSNLDKQTYSDDMLFATLDTSARQIRLNNKDIIISDTVGFISELPTRLVESFKSTIEEIEISDLILIVIDTSNEFYELQLDATKEVLKDMNISDKKILYVFNKIDKNPEFKYYGNIENEIYISAFLENDIENLGEKISDLLYEDYLEYDALIPYSEYNNLFDYIVNDIKEEYLEEGIKTKLLIHPEEVGRFKRYINDE